MNYSSVTGTSDSSVLLSTIPGREHATRTRTEYRLRRDGKRVDVSARMQYDVSRAEFNHHRSILTNDYSITYETWPKEKAPSGAIVSRDLPKRLAEITCNGTWGNGLDGAFLACGGRRLADLMLTSDALSILPDEVISSVPCKVLKAFTAYGMIQLWIAPSKSYDTLKLIHEMGPSDLSENDLPLSQCRPLRVNGKEFFLTRVQITVDGVKTRKIEGAHIPVEGRVLTSELYRGGYSEVGEELIRRDSVDLHPNFQGTDAFVPDLPDGTPLTDQDSPKAGIAYVWRGGKIVPKAVEFPNLPRKVEPKAAVFDLALAGWTGAALAALLVAVWILCRIWSAYGSSA